MEKKIKLNKDYLDNAIELFIQGIDSGPFKGFNYKNLCSDTVLKKNPDKGKDIYRLAVDQAWLDVCRTFPNGDKNEEIRGYYGEIIKDAFAKDGPIDVYNLIFSRDPDSLFQELTIGQKQKIVNMALKYLFCCSDFRNDCNRKKFENSHMPLDSFTLEWFKRIVSKGIDNYPDNKFKLTISMISSWSTLKGDNEHDDYEDGGKKYYSYRFYQEKISDYINNHIDGTWSSLEVEFFVWPETQLLLATEAYIFAIDQDAKRNEIRNEKSLTDKLNILKEELNKNNRNVIWFD